VQGLPKSLFYFSVFVLLLSSCAPSQEALAAQTSTAQTAQAAAWTATTTATATATATATPTLTSTNTSTSKPTETPTIVLSFSDEGELFYQIADILEWGVVDSESTVCENPYEEISLYNNADIYFCNFSNPDGFEWEHPGTFTPTPIFPNWYGYIGILRHKNWRFDDGQEYYDLYLVVTNVIIPKEISSDPDSITALYPFDLGELGASRFAYIEQVWPMPSTEYIAWDIKIFPSRLPWYDFLAR
jgi:hypothetical protein